MAFTPDSLNVPGITTGNVDNPLETVDNRIGGDNLPPADRLSLLAQKLLEGTSLAGSAADIFAAAGTSPAASPARTVNPAIPKPNLNRTPANPEGTVLSRALGQGLDSLTNRATGALMGVDAMIGNEEGYNSLAAANDARDAGNANDPQYNFLDDPGEYMLQLIGNSLPEMGVVGASALAGGVGGAAFFGVGAIPGAIMGAAAGFAASFPLFFGGHIERQRLEGASFDELSPTNAALAAVPAAAMDTLATLVPLGIGLRAAGKIGAKAAEDVATRSFARELGGAVAADMAVESVTEGSQAALERLQAGLSLTDAAAISEIAENGFGGLLLGGLFGGAGHTVGHLARDRKGPEVTPPPAGDTPDAPATVPDHELSLSDYAGKQLERIKNQDALNWQTPGYRGDPRVPAALSFWGYVGTAEGTIARIGQLPADQRNKPENISALSDAHEVLDLMKALRDPRKSSQQSRWVLDVGDKPVALETGANGHPVYKQGGKVLETAKDGTPITDAKGPVWVRTAAGNDVKVKLSTVRDAVHNVNDVVRDNILISPKMQERMKTLMHKALAAGQGVFEAATQPSNVLALPRPGDRMVTFRDGVQGDLFPNLPNQNVPAQPAPAAEQTDLFNQPGGPDLNQTELDVTVTDPARERATAGTRATLTAAAQINSAALQAQAANTARPLPKRIPVDHLPAQLLQRMRINAVNTGKNLPTTVTPAELRQIATDFGADPDAVEAATKEALFRRTSEQQTGGVAPASQSSQRGTAGILAAVPASERVAVSRVLRIFSKLIGRPLNELDVIDLAEWASRTNQRLDGHEAALFLPKWIANTATGVERAAIALHTGRDTSQDVSNVAHELTHFLMRMVGFDPASMERLYNAIPATDPIKAWLEGDRHYQTLPVWERMEEYFAYHVEGAVNRKVGTNKTPETASVLREFMAHMVEFVRTVFDALVGRDVVTDALLGIQQEYGVSVFTGMRATRDLPLSTLKRIAKYGLAEGTEETADPNGLLRREIRIAQQDRGQDTALTEEQQASIVDALMTSLPNGIVDAIDQVRSTQTGAMVGTLQTAGPRDVAQALYTELLGLLNEGRGGRFWYERSGIATLDYVGGSGAKGINNTKAIRAEADKLAQLFAVYSPREGVMGNTHKAMTAWTRWKSGQPVWLGREITKSPLVNRVVGTFKTEREARALYVDLGAKSAGYTLRQSGQSWIVENPAMGQAEAMASRLNDRGGEKHTAVEFEAADGSKGAMVVVTDANHDNIGGTDRDFVAHQLLFNDRPFSGRKVNNFWQNLTRMWTNGAQGVTVDMWMSKAFGFVNMEDISPNRFTLIEGMSKAVSEQIGWEPQQVQAAIWTAIKARFEMTANSANELALSTGVAESGPKGVRPVTGKEGIYSAIQRQLAMQVADDDPGLVERTGTMAVRDFSDFMAGNLAQISWESAPSASSGHLAGYETASDEARAEHHRRIKSAMEDAQGRDMLVAASGLLNPGVVSGPGHYKGTTVPGTQDIVGATRAKGRAIARNAKTGRIDRERVLEMDPAAESLIRAVAAARSLVLMQDQIGYHRPFFDAAKKNANGIELVLGKRVTDKHLLAIRENLIAVMDDIGFADLADAVALIPSRTGLRAVNFTGGHPIATFATEEEANAKAAEMQPHVVGTKGAYMVLAPATDAEFGPFATKGVADRFAVKFARTRVVSRKGLFDAKTDTVEQRLGSPRTWEVVYETIPNTTFHDIVTAAGERAGLTTDTKTFASAGGLVGEDWTDAQGQIEGLIATVVSAGRPDLLWTARVLRERVSVVERAAESDWGWKPNDALVQHVEASLDGVLDGLAGGGLHGADAAAGEAANGEGAQGLIASAEEDGIPSGALFRREFDTRDLPAVALVTDDKGRSKPALGMDNIARGRAAFNRVMNLGRDVQHAIFVPAINQYISFLRGDAKGGLDHAMRQRPGEKLTAEAKATQILKTLTYGTASGPVHVPAGSTTARVNVQYQGYLVAVGLTNADAFDAPNWLITSFDAGGIKPMAAGSVSVTNDELKQLQAANDGTPHRLPGAVKRILGPKGWISRDEMEANKAAESSPAGRKFGRVGEMTTNRVPSIFRRVEGGPTGEPNESTPGTEAGELPNGGSVLGGAVELAAQRGEGDAPQGPTEATDAVDLAGLPKQVIVPGVGEFVAGAFATARRAAREYMAKTGRDYTPPSAHVTVDPARAARIADAYEAMVHAPQDPVVKAAYAALADETLAQWSMVEATGLTVEWSENPYPESPRLVTEDIRANNHMLVFPTDAGYGENPINEADIADNPMLRLTDIVIDGKRARVNDIFRVVHDYFGHVKDGVGFRASGEENAWRSHAAMFSPLARMALTSETRGQNSWLNYGPHGEANRTAQIGDTVFAEQKVGLLPDWAISEGTEDFLSAVDYAAVRAKAADEVSLTEGFSEDDAHPFSAATETLPETQGLVDMRDDFLAALDAPKFRREYNPEQTNTPAFKSWFKESEVVDAEGNPWVRYHATRSDFSTFAQGELGFHFGSMGQAHDRIGVHFDDRIAMQDGLEITAPPRSGANMMPVYLKIENPMPMRDLGNWEDPMEWDIGLSRMPGVNDPGEREFMPDSEKAHLPVYDALSAYVQKARVAEGEAEMAANKADEDGYEARQNWRKNVFAPAIRRILAEHGYDGMKYWNAHEGTYNLDNPTEDDHYAWVAFQPTQIKSAIGNGGTFDGSNPDVRFRRSPGEMLDTARQPAGTGTSMPSWWLKYLSKDFINTSTVGAIVANGRGTSASRRLANLIARSKFAVGADEQTGGVLAEGYHGAVEGAMGKYAAPLVRALQPIAGKTIDKARKSKANKKTLAKALRGALATDASGNPVYTGTGVDQSIVDNVRGVLDNLYDYLVEAMKQGGAVAADIPAKMQNYFPQLWQIEGVHDADHLAGANRRDVLQQWFKAAGVFSGSSEQDSLISSLLDKMSAQDGLVTYGFSIEDALEKRISADFYGEFERLLHFPATSAFNVKHNGVDVRVELSDLLDNDAYRVLNQHTIRTVRRAEFVRRFGLKGQVFNQHLTEMDAELVGQGDRPLTLHEKVAIRRSVQANFGLLGADFRVSHPFWMKTMSAMRLFTDFATLTMASIASVPEFVMPSVRFGMRGQLNSLQANISELLRTQSAADMRHFAEDIGVIGQTIHHAMMEQVQENSPYLMEKVRNEFFKWNLLQPITNIQRAGATAAAIQSVRRWADKAAAGDAKHTRFLKEVGLTHEMAASFDPDNYSATATPAIRAAIRQMVNETVVAPNPSQRPAWHSDPRFMLLAQIKGWFSAFNNTVLQRAGREMTMGNFAPLIYLMGYAALSATVYSLREWARWGEEGNPFMGRALESLGVKNSAEARFGYLMVERGGLLGPAQMLADMMVGSRIGREPNLGATMSPFAGLVETFIQGTSDVVFALDDKQFRRGIDRISRVIPGVNMMGGSRDDLITFLTGTEKPTGGSSGGSGGNLLKLNLSGFNINTKIN